MPIGIMNDLAIFMYTMYNLFKDMLDSGMAVFLVYILVFYSIVEKYFTILENALVYLY